MDLQDVALFRYLPALAGRLPWVRVGHWPTAVEPLPGIGGEVWVKREDLASPIYGGNKVRTLEALLGRATAAGATSMWATGAYGSNHALATVVHARTVGLRTGVIAFPQPASSPARANLAAMIAADTRFVRIPTIALLPFAMRRVAATERAAGERPYVMPPGGAGAEGAIGALSAAIELADQVARGVCPAPARIVVAAGSACTTAGLLAGLHLAAALGIGFAPGRVPRVTAVRVTPWPVSVPWRVALLARHALTLIDRLRGADSGVGVAALRARLDVLGAYYGGGYGRATAGGLRAIERFRAAGGPPLDLVYSAKAGAALLDLAPRSRGPILFWATKSSSQPPPPTPRQLGHADPALRAWLDDHSASVAAGAS